MIRWEASIIILVLLLSKYHLSMQCQTTNISHVVYCNFRLNQYLPPKKDSAMNWLQGKLFVREFETPFRTLFPFLLVLFNKMQRNRLNESPSDRLKISVVVVYSPQGKEKRPHRVWQRKRIKKRTHSPLGVLFTFGVHFFALNHCCGD